MFGDMLVDPLREGCAVNVTSVNKYWLEIKTVILHIREDVHVFIVSAVSEKLLLSLNV